MKKGFTILELLVASLLLGMLMTILTMIFSQSSIAWRTGLAGVADLDDVRSNVAEVRDEADNAYIWDNDLHKILSVWDGEPGENARGAELLRKRAWNVGEESPQTKQANRVDYLKTNGHVNFRDDSDIKDFNQQADVNANASDVGFLTYQINIKSSGPNKKLGDYDDIWSNPDDFID